MPGVHSMPLTSFLTEADRKLAEAIARLTYCNPFLPARIECERAALGSDFIARGTSWHATGEPEPTPNLHALAQRSQTLAERLAAKLVQGARPPEAELTLYEDVVVYLLFSR